MSTHPIHVFSEIGKLKKVCLHRPGKELENLMPDYLERLLFDDIPFLEDAQKEHDAFAEALRNEGIEVLYLEQLVKLLYVILIKIQKLFQKIHQLE